MRVKYRLRNSNIWKDIPNVEMPITIIDTFDETFDNGKISFIIQGNHSDFNELINITPKSYIMLSETSEDSEINELNTYYFTTTKVPNARLRKEVRDSLNAITTNSLWQVEITGMELVKELEDTEMTNYTITQPKTQYFSRYSRFLVDRYTFNQNTTYSSASKINLVNTNKSTINNANNTTQIATTITSGSLVITLNNIETESYTINANLQMQRTASGKTALEPLFAKPFSEATNYLPDTYFVIEKKYYNVSSVLIATITQNIDLEHYKSIGNIPYNSIEITGFGDVLQFNMTTSIDKKPSADYCVVSLSVYKTRAIKNYKYANSSYIEVPTLISGLANDSYVKAQIKTIELEITSNQLSDEIVEQKYTLLSFVEKALFDYNFNKRNKLTLSDDAKVILDVFAKESEWSGYNFRELLNRAFKYVGVLPYITIDRKITYVKTKVVDTQFNISDFEDNANSRIDEDYYDTVVSTSKNLVSDDDFTTENVALGSGSDEFSQLTSSNASFLMNTPIYYISSAKLYAPITFSIVANGTTYTINSNIGVANYWDITRRLVDSDLYKALPNVNFSSKAGRTSGQLGQGNTITFKSGDRLISGLGNQAPEIPTFNPISNNAEIAQYAIIELLICLAHEYIMDNYGKITSDFNDFEPSEYPLSTISNFELELVFVPYHKEITTKYVSDKSDRKGLNYQKRLNVSDRTIDYKENELVLRNEMSRKGNIQKVISQKYASINETLAVGSIVNGGNYTISSKRMLINKNMVDCEYTLDSEYINQNTDVGLGVEYSRYNVPYEFVNREIFIDNHLIFSKTTTTDYASEPTSCTLQFLQDIFAKDTFNDYTLDKQIYSQMLITHSDLSTRRIFMKMNKLTSKFSMILSGSFIDNYNAGNQKWNNGSLIYSQPFRYCDYRGRVSKISELEIGYSPKQKYHIDNSYSINNFPDNPSEYFALSRQMFISGDDFLLDKDARESIAVNHHTYLESVSDDVRFYNFNTVNAFGSLRDNLKLVDNLTIQDINFTYWETIPISITFTSVANNGYRVDISVPTQDIVVYGIDLSKGIVLLNTDGKSLDLVGIVQTPTIITNPISTTISVYVYNTRYGKK